MFLDLFLDALRNSVLITGLVITMMLMIEFINVVSHGKLFAKLGKSRVGQVILGSCLGIVPGCLGGFAAVSLYSHKMISLGALIATMIASSGDEAFVMLAMIPKEAAVLFVILFAISVITGLIVDMFPSKRERVACPDEYVVHSEDSHDFEGHSLSNMKHPGKERIILLVGVTAFIVALAFGMFEHGGEGGEHLDKGSFNILDEYWLNLVFAIMSLFVLWFIAVSSRHFVKEHLWNHVVKKHLLSVFCWTFGALLLIEIGLHYLDISAWTKANVPFMIVLAVLVGMIPESGPHLLFVTLFAGGMVPFSVLLASSISQDGHTSLPLLAETKRGFLKAKLINAAVGLIAGFGFFFFGL